MTFPRGDSPPLKAVYVTSPVREKAIVLKGKKIGSYTGRVAVRATGSFNIQTSAGLVQGVSHRYCTVVQRGNGYGYSLVAKTDVRGTPP